ncbi:MAG: DUF2207 domain-containing protein [Patescibacteria group bacterium]|nr:DUF2207 domain-containing protein [Patescibacteria group bacterium]
MKKILFTIILTLLFAAPAFAYDTSDTGWKISDFNSKIDISQNQNVHVLETIKADFADLSKHGIYRYIPYKYNRNGNNYNVRIKINSVQNDSGANITYQESREGDNVVIKIGDAEKTISGAQTYLISYDLERVINHFSKSDEFYFNVTGSDWPVPVNSVQAQVNWPSSAQIKDNICFVGSFASNNQDCDISLNSKTVDFKSKSSLNAGEGFTIASSIEPGALTPYSWWQIISWFLSDNWGYLIPVFALLLLLLIYFKKGRDPKGRTTIAPEFAPPDKLLPAEMGTIYDERVDSQDISAAIIDLAVKGYLTIKELNEKKFLGFTNKDYELAKTKKSASNLQNYEQKIFKAIFEDGDVVKLSDLQDSFYKEVKDIKDDIYQLTLEKGYFADNPEATRNTYVGIGVSIMAISFLVILPFVKNSLSVIIGLVASGLLFIVFAFSMPRRTAKGVETNRQIKGFLMYMNTAERYRQEFNEDKHIFEKFLPYAMVFGIVKKWAEAFKDLQVPRPSWYYGEGYFYPVIFATSLNNFQHVANATLITPPSSAGAGGSGFSGGGVGGGFGGGGGGSW